MMKQFTRESFTHHVVKRLEKLPDDMCSGLSKEEIVRTTLELLRIERGSLVTVEDG